MLMQLTAASIRGLTCPAGRSEKIYFDDALPGFGLRVRSSGVRSLVFQYGFAGKTRRITLGPPEIIGLARARSEAKNYAAAARLGGDPAAAKSDSRALAAETIAAILPRYMARQRQRLRPRSYIEIERHLLVHARPVHNVPLTRLTRRDIASLLTEVASSRGAATSNRVRSSLAAFCGWATKEGLIEHNVVAYSNQAPEPTGRTRTPSIVELVRIWKGLDGCSPRFATILKLLMLLGLRRCEVGDLRWSEFSPEAATLLLPGSRVKSGRDHLVPLASQALELLEAERRRWIEEGGVGEHVFGTSGGFSDWHRAKAQLDAHLAADGGPPMEHWTLHDIRRSFSTFLHEDFATAPHVIEACLGHVGHQSGVPGRYNRASYIDERRRALIRWADHLTGLIEGKPAVAKVVPIR
jgi:integrase